MTQMLEAVVTSTAVFELLAEGGPHTVAEIAEHLMALDAEVATIAGTLADAGYFHFDESARFATWCAWPRAGL